MCLGLTVVVSGLWVRQNALRRQESSVLLVSTQVRTSRTSLTQEISGKQGLAKVVKASRMVIKAKSRHTNETQRGLSLRMSLKDSSSENVQISDPIFLWAEVFLLCPFICGPSHTTFSLVYTF